MPIPSRPIPTPAPRRAPTTQPTTSSKPGSSLPRRGLTFTDYAEVYDLPLPSSAPVKGLSGVSMVHKKTEVKAQEPKKMEVGVECLILDGLGKREKRSTTATSLGFDFIPNPSIVVLPDQPSTSPNSLKAQSPSTPALVPTQAGEQEVENEDDDWEHITGDGVNADHDDREVGGDEGDMIFLGELELEDHHAESKGHQAVVKKGGKSYAAAAGSTVKA